MQSPNRDPEPPPIGDDRAHRAAAPAQPDADADGAGRRPVHPAAADGARIETARRRRPGDGHAPGTDTAAGRRPTAAPHPAADRPHPAYGAGADERRPARSRHHHIRYTGCCCWLFARFIPNGVL